MKRREFVTTSLVAGASGSAAKDLVAKEPDCKNLSVDELIELHDTIHRTLNEKTTEKHEENRRKLAPYVKQLREMYDAINNKAIEVKLLVTCQVNFFYDTTTLYDTSDNKERILRYENMMSAPDEAKVPEVEKLYTLLTAKAKKFEAFITSLSKKFNIKEREIIDIVSSTPRDQQ